jgi:hypothetical protein
MAFETDQEVITAALQTIGLVEPPEARVIQIANTLHLAEVRVSEAYQQDVAGREDLEVMEPARDMGFDASGNLIPVHSH